MRTFAVGEAHVRFGKKKWEVDNVKVLTDGMELEMTVKEYAELVALRDEPKMLTFEEEVKLLESLRHFQILNWHWDSESDIYITLKRDRG